MSSLKVCTKCGAGKPLTEFKTRKDSPTGYRTTCRTCDGENRKQWYQNTIEVRRAKQVVYDATRYNDHRDVILARCSERSKNNRSCKKC